MTHNKKSRGTFVLFIAFISTNVAFATTFATYGLIVDALNQEFAGSRTLVSLGIALVMLTMGLAAPTIGVLLDKWSTRGVMVTGYLIGAVSFYLASQATSIIVFVFLFGVVGGVSFACVATLPATKLACNWFPASSGRAIALTCLPLAVAAAPPLLGSYLVANSWRTLFENYSLLYLAMIPLLLFIKAYPDSIEAAEQQQAAQQSDAGQEGFRHYLSSPKIWLLGAASGFLVSSGVIASTHMVAHGLGLGFGLEQASVLLALTGGSSMLGALFFGWVSDRTSPAFSLKLNACLQIVFWLIIANQNSFAGLAFGVALIGLCGGGYYPSLSAKVNDDYGAMRLGLVLGVLTFLYTPITFFAPPIAGAIFDFTGSYYWAFILQASLCCLALFILFLQSRTSGAAGVR